MKIFGARIPFNWLPGSWGLVGKSRDIAKAEYELSGIDLERKLAKINADDEAELKIELLKIDRKHNLITKEEYDYKYADLNYGDTDQYDLMILKLDKKYGKITEAEYQKKEADLNELPWIGCISSEYRQNMGTDGFAFELDWNKKFVEMLVSEGYAGQTDEAIVEQWFEDKATQEYLKVLNEEVESIPETDDWSVPQTHISRTKTDDGKIRHS